MEDATNLILAAIDRVDKQVSEVRSEVHEQGKQIAKLEVNQENLKDDLTGIKSSVDKIHEVDIEQTRSLDEHIKRTEILEGNMETFEKNQKDIVNVIKSLKPSDVEVTKAKIGFWQEFIKAPWIKWVVGAILAVVVFLITGEKVNLIDLFK